MAATVFDKIWNQHRVHALSDDSELIALDRVFLHERTGAIALSSLRESGRPVRDPSRTFATMDHIVDTFPGRGDDCATPGGREYIQTMRREAKAAGITLFDMDDPRHGIAHLIAAEQGIALPGLIIACPDSHTCTLGALGAIGWGIGTSDCEHALATQTLRSNKPKQMLVQFNGPLQPGVTAKDMILHLIGHYGAAGAKGYAVEFAGEAIENLPMAGRFTLCNMAVEFSAFTGLIAPDSTTLDYIKDRPYTPSGDGWATACEYWQQLHSDHDATFDQILHVASADIRPSISWGTSPEHTIALGARVPNLNDAKDDQQRDSWQAALEYMGLRAGQSLLGLPIDGAFIGSCTNSRISDLRAAAEILNGRQVAAGVRAICTPGSATVKRQAEEEGLDQVFLQAGFEWREPGCSLCFFAGGESFDPGNRVITSTNRNFRGRQGPGVRSHLTSPVTVAAAAVAGAITDIRPQDTAALAKRSA